LASNKVLFSFNVLTFDRIQESTDRKDPGRIPRTIDCDLVADLVDSCVPGDVITVCGEVTVINKEPEKVGKGKEKNKAVFDFRLLANSLDNQRQVDPNKFGTELTQKDFAAIELISREKDLFGLLVHSICPSIYGHELVKGT
jgi:DNA helicase MCM8